MVNAVNSVQALSVLYDLALTIGSEVTVDALLTRTLQRFLYHTGFPAGVVYSRGAALDDPAWKEVRLEAAIGNYGLVKRKGECLRLPATLADPTSALIEADDLPDWFPARKPYRFCLRLPIPDFGAVLLLTPTAPDSALPLTELFAPIMARLATAITLCQRIRERTEALESANRELEAFSYSVSHDLRAPLRAIDGFSHILLEDYGGKLDAEGLRLLDAVRDNAVRMSRLIDDILRFSRMSVREMQTAPIDMTSLTREVADELQTALAGRVVRFDIAAMPPAQGDRAMIRQVLVNLLENALKFTRPRAQAVVEVGSTPDEQGNAYCVRDNGVGFDMQYADKLFGVFERLHGREQFEGTGIGLAIVKRIVARHGGRVWAEGKVDAGAAMHFTLPRAEAAALGEEETARE